MSDIYEKQENLKAYIKSFGSMAVAFSGGVDSTYLLKVAHEVLGDNVVGITAQSSTYPKREFDEAKAFTKLHGINHITVVSEELDIDGFSENPINRCYLCKQELFTKLKAMAQENNITSIAEGSNLDDNGDYRPGLVAVKEFEILSPLRYAELTKNEIRELSKAMGLSTWNKPSFACLSSRFPYGESITPKKLNMVDRAEQFLFDSGFKQFRVRIHNNLARIEIEASDFPKLLQEETRETIHSKFKEIGFDYVSLDLKGYRMGSMNETLKI